MTAPNPFPPSLAGGNRVADLTVDALNTTVVSSLGALSIGGTSLTIPTHVGIGKAATSQPLDVSGNANVSGFLFASNVGIGTSVVTSMLTVAGDVACSGKFRGNGSLLTGISSGGGGASVPQIFSSNSSYCYTKYRATNTGASLRVGTYQNFSPDPALEGASYIFVDDYGSLYMTSTNTINLSSPADHFNISGGLGTSFIDAPYLKLNYNNTLGRIYTYGNMTMSGTKSLTATGITATFDTLYYVTEFAQSSDQRLKKNITDISGSSLQLIEQLRPVTYQWNELHNQIFNTHPDDNGNDICGDIDNDVYSGFIAQDLECVLPCAVGTMVANNESYKTIKPVVLIPYLVKAIQELSKQVKLLQAQVSAT